MVSNGDSYNDEVKKDVVQLIVEEKRSVVCVVRDFGASDLTILYG